MSGVATMIASRLLTSPPGLLASSLWIDLTVLHLLCCANTIFSMKQRISYAPISVFSRMFPALRIRAQMHINVCMLLQLIHERRPEPMPPNWEGIPNGAVSWAVRRWPNLEHWQNPSYFQLRVQAYSRSPLLYCSKQTIISVDSCKTPWERLPFAWDSLPRGGSGLMKQEGWSDTSAPSHGSSLSLLGLVSRVTTACALGRVFPRHSLPCWRLPAAASPPLQSLGVWRLSARLPWLKFNEAWYYWGPFSVSSALISK